MTDFTGTPATPSPLSTATTSMTLAEMRAQAVLLAEGGITGLLTNAQHTALLNRAYKDVARESLCFKERFAVQTTEDMVASVTLTAAGTGYTSPPTVTIAAPGSGVQATAVAEISGTAISAVRITNCGSGYTTVPSVSFGSGAAAATAVLGIRQDYALNERCWQIRQVWYNGKRLSAKTENELSESWDEWPATGTGTPQYYCQHGVGASGRLLVYPRPSIEGALLDIRAYTMPAALVNESDQVDVLPPYDWLIVYKAAAYACQTMVDDPQSIPRMAMCEKRYAELMEEFKGIQVPIETEVWRGKDDTDRGGIRWDGY